MYINNLELKTWRGLYDFSGEKVSEFDRHIERCGLISAHVNDN
jgi:hypothetical protein